MVRTLESDEKIAAAQAKLLSIDGKHIDGVGDHIDMFGYPMILGHGDIDRGQYDRSKEIFGGRAAALCIRKDIFKRLGGFDPSFFAGCEDVDMCWRARLHGYKIVYVHKAVVYHIGGYTVKKIRRLSKAPSDNLLSLIAKNFEIGNFIKSLPLMFFVYLFSIARALVKGDRDACLEGIKATLRALNKLRTALYKRSTVQQLRHISDRELLSSDLVFKGSIFILLIAAGLMWSLKYKKIYPSFETYWNSIPLKTPQ